MEGLATYWQQADTVGRAVGLMLLLMSVSTWAVIFWKAWMLTRARRDLAVGTSAFWRAADLASARSALQTLDRDGVLLPSVEAVQAPEAPGTLATRALPEAQLTRRLRDSLHGVLARLQAGQVLLASVGAVSPFVGLFGTVWGVFHAMQAISQFGLGGARSGRRPGGRGPHHDGRRPGGGHPGGAGLQPLWQAHCANRGRPGRLRARPARHLAVPGSTEALSPWLSAA